jgi:hypothetical protein
MVFSCRSVAGHIAFAHDNASKISGLFLQIALTAPLFSVLATKVSMLIFITPWVGGAQAKKALDAPIICFLLLLMQVI